MTKMDIIELLEVSEGENRKLKEALKESQKMCVTLNTTSTKLAKRVIEQEDTISELKKRIKELEQSKEEALDREQYWYEELSSCTESNNELIDVVKHIHDIASETLGYNPYQE